MSIVLHPVTTKRMPLCNSVIIFRAKNKNKKIEKRALIVTSFIFNLPGMFYIDDCVHLCTSRPWIRLLFWEKAASLKHQLFMKETTQVSAFSFI